VQVVTGASIATLPPNVALLAAPDAVPIEVVSPADVVNAYVSSDTTAEVLPPRAVPSTLGIAMKGEVACGPTGAPGAPGDIARRGPLKVSEPLETGDLPPPHPVIVTSSNNVINLRPDVFMLSSLFILRSLLTIEENLLKNPHQKSLYSVLTKG
jgi:hypothetical protein